MFDWNLLLSLEKVNKNLTGAAPILHRLATLSNLDITKESIIDWTYSCENLPNPYCLPDWQEKDSQRGTIPPFGKGREGGI
jgi:hypothetical protein